MSDSKKNNKELPSSLLCSRADVKQGRVFKGNFEKLLKESRIEEVKRFTRNFIERYRSALEALAKK